MNPFYIAWAQEFAAWVIGVSMTTGICCLLAIFGTRERGGFIDDQKRIQERATLLGVLKILSAVGLVTLLAGAVISIPAKMIPGTYQADMPGVEK